MNQFFLHGSHGYSLPSINGGDAKCALSQIKEKGVRLFQDSLGLDEIRQKSAKRVIVIVGSGMSTLSQGMSTPSWFRARRALELLQNEPSDTLVVPTARFTYRLLLNKILPPSTDARRISEFLIRSGIPPKNIINEEWSNCTFGNAVFTRLLIDACVSPSARIFVVTSDWALERAQIVFHLLFRGRNITYETVNGDLSPEDERQRRKQEEIVNRHLYIPSIPYYGLEKGSDSLTASLWYLREINTSTPGNIPDWFALTTTAAVQFAEINSSASYGVK